MIQLSGVSRTFDGRAGRVEALRGIDLDVAEGEFLAVLGRSGCGKSTLLRMIAGLIPATAGQITVAGTPITRPRRDIAMLFQRPALLPWRSVLDNVLLPVEIFGWSRAKHRERARELLELAGLAGFEKRLPHELSGGMQQRVSLCRSLIGDPRVMLMDEPFSALDALTREELSGELQRIHVTSGATVVFVTHSIDEAVLLADRVVVLSPRPGRIRSTVQVDIPRPRTLGRNAHLADVARVSAELHELLMERDAPTGPADAVATPAGSGVREEAPAKAGTEGR
ncbi:ABC transporter ATP-binding protein [Micromonospora olivasterospora]|uniref:NitT/TauT family transport system ATP-binding protein n=1 Tax=Micromonospora olivasterospora TaxID=1880 RepID=A0A562I789_MICOL|nr:ABC transporter ATP-binding protein [Micromonospora olivasterospora]TWH66585.1 NitT/TauT family transport system ATP-binding protein [Micromonospora olivasterospora]